MKRLIKARSEKEATSERQVLADWRRYFEDLLNSKPPEPSLNPATTTYDNDAPLLDPSDFDSSPFTDEDIDRAIKSFKNGKAPGIDSIITTELLKGTISDEYSATYATRY